MTTRCTLSSGTVFKTSMQSPRIMMFFSTVFLDKPGIFQDPEKSCAFKKLVQGLTGVASRSRGSHLPLPHCQGTCSAGCPRCLPSSYPESPGAVRVLFIGGTGFIGAHIVRQIARHDHAVAVYHRGLTQAVLPELVQHITDSRSVIDDAWEIAFVPALVRGTESFYVLGCPCVFLLKS